MNNIVSLFLCLFFYGISFGQDIPMEKDHDTIQGEYFMFEGDSIFVKNIELDDVYVLKNLKFEDKDERIQYLILKRKVKKVYPYAKMASDKLTDLTNQLDSIKGKRARKRYTKKIQKFIEQEFSEELKKLTRTEGQILVKLIHRQTGRTAFSLVKELR
ncbi:MAG: DUF4294 domain-containing protein, partial [Flavobacteriaceae bacterium]|nr:DUF4294 domain-containing protein [Flavobacteriaceae bacterium]